MFIYIFMLLFLCSSNLSAQNCEEIPGFVENPQYTGGPNQDECYPEQFVYYSSISQGFYLFLEVLLNDYEISSEDWVGAFNGEICVGARHWGGCGGSSACDVPVLGDDGSLLTDGYMMPGDIPSFKIYDVSEGIYIDAQASSYIPWYTNMTVPINQLYANISIEGCTDSNACNYNPYATINNGNCEYLTCNSDYWDYDNDGVLDNYNNYEYNGSVTAIILLDGNYQIQPGDMLAAFVDNEQRGVGYHQGPTPFGPYVGSYMFPIMIFSNETGGEIIDFYYYDESIDQIFHLNETISWESNMIIGDALNPFIFNFDESWLSSSNIIIPNSFSITNIYPNPFNPKLNIEFKIKNTSKIIIEFYDLTGRKIDSINLGILEPNNHKITWSPTNIPSGLYMITMTNGTEIYKTRATFLK